MTAEIAILNRSAIAFAADSAVTISVGSKEKVYDTAEKLFELSRRQPLALMIYNNVEFVGVPLDVLIRKFRVEVADETDFASVRDVGNSFVNYLKDFPHDDHEENVYFVNLLRPKFDRVNRMLQGKGRSIIESLKDGTVTPEQLPTPMEMVFSIVESERKKEETFSLPNFLNGVNITRFRSRYRHLVKYAADNFIGFASDFDRKTLLEIERYAFSLIKSSRSSPLKTGLVFGGFADEDMFPTLYYIEIDGIFFGELKTISCSEVDIDRKNTKAEVVPFAQKEMVERFMYGLDAELESEIRRFVSGAISDVIDAAAIDMPENVGEQLRATTTVNFPFIPLTHVEHNAISGAWKRNRLLHRLNFRSASSLRAFRPMMPVSITSWPFALAGRALPAHHAARKVAITSWPSAAPMSALLAATT